MVSMLMAALATWFAVADEVPTWDCSQGDRVVWRVESEFHYPGFPVVDGDRVLLGANFVTWKSGRPENNRGIMTAYSRADGRKLWDRSHPRLPSRQNDMVGSMFARPTLDGEQAYYISNRGELMCVSVLSGQPEWTLDMPTRLGVTKRDWGDVVNPLPGTAVAGSLVFAVTGNGWDFGRPLSSLTAPSLVAADKKTGKVVWTFAVPAADLRYSWSSPVIATMDGQTRLLLPGGDGRLYCFEPPTGRLLWQREPPGFGREPRGPGNHRDFFAATPTVRGHILYGGLSHATEMGPDPNRTLFALDLKAAETDPDHALLWTFSDPKFGGTFGPPAATDNLLFVNSASDVLFALDRATGKEHWREELEDSCSYLAAPLVADGRVYILGWSDLLVFDASDSKRMVGKYTFDSHIVGTPAHKDGILYVATGHGLWAVRSVDR